MKKNHPSESVEPTEESLKMLDGLRAAVRKAVERKRRLGQYYVVWEDGRPVAIGEDAPRDDNGEPVKHGK